MLLFELVIGLLFAGSVFALWANKIGAPYPALLALLGAGIALLPGVPNVQLGPELALALFVAPTLADAAYDASPRDLRRLWAPVLSLAVLLVLATTFAVAVALRHVAPEVGWAAALALGAMVAPSDAPAATAVLNALRPPHRLMVILEGESLFNDATALSAYRIAVSAALTGAMVGWTIISQQLLAFIGGILVGYLAARLAIVLLRRIDDTPVLIVLQFVGVFGVWLLANRLGLSAIITMVVYAMTLGQRQGARVEARQRLAAYAVWEVAVLVLNVIAFVFIGLQLGAIVDRVNEGEWHRYAVAGAAVCATVIVLRIAWVLSYVTVARWNARRRALPGPTYRNAAIVSWCGMRGIVTLATALALPAGPNAFPDRDLLIFCAFCVVLCTLVIQGLTLAPLMRFLGVRDDGSVDLEVRIARAETARAAMRSLQHQGTNAGGDVLSGEYRARLQSAETPAAAEPLEASDASMASLELQAVAAQRRSLDDLRRRGVIGDDAYHVVEGEIDLLEMSAKTRLFPSIPKIADAYDDAFHGV